MGSKLSGYYNAPYDLGQRNRNRIEDIAHKGWEPTKAPIWGDGVRMKKLEKLIKEMDTRGLEEINVNVAAEIMENSADAAGHIINSCTRFKRIKPGHYKLLPKGTETEQTTDRRVNGVKVDKILAFMAKQGKTEIMIKDAADLTTSTTNNIYDQLMADDRLVKTGRGRFGLASEHKPEPAHKPISALIPKPNNDPDELSLDEKIAKAKSDRVNALPNGAYTEQQDKPEESMPVQGDTAANTHEAKMNSIELEKRNKLIIQQRDLIRDMRAYIETLNKKLTAQSATTPINQDQEALKKMYSNIDCHSCTEQLPTAQPADEPRKIIRLSLCPHCGRQIITD